GALGDGVSFVGNAFLMRSNGTTNQDGAVYLYVPDADPTKMRVAPFTVIVDSNGRLRLMRWRDGVWE
ncbi:MAG: hypothetical protein KKE17_11655, partial [Proteobacteria bacterium]|nr:hypothetical protein [Pseudomonadota bacterium]MBU1710650.1 hypothetical protein [Pseudomonadota bacterium]